MKPRRELKVGEKVRFEDMYNQKRIGKVAVNYAGTCLYEIDVDGRVFKNVHRRQVLATFRKKEKVTNKEFVEYLNQVSSKYQEALLESQFKKPVYQWQTYVPDAQGDYEWRVYDYLCTREEMIERMKVVASSSKNIRIHAGPFEGEAP